MNVQISQNSRQLATPAGHAALDALQFMMHWTECLHGDALFRDALSEFAHLAQAEVVHLHRVQPDTGNSRTIASHDRGAKSGARPLTRPFGLALVGASTSRAKPGTLWSMHELDLTDAAALSPRTKEWMAARGLREAVLIPLSMTECSADLLELFLPASPDRAARQALEMLAVALARAWNRRPEGRISRILRAAPTLPVRPVAAESPLAMHNPMMLTAAEWRICTLIRDGAAVDQIGGMLGIAESTLRTHLGNIFAKTGVTGQVGLVRLLLEPEAAPRQQRA